MPTVDSVLRLEFDTAVAGTRPDGTYHISGGVIWRGYDPG